MQDLKTCQRCNEEKPLNLFGKDAQKKDGLRSYCKVCVNNGSRLAYQALSDEAITNLRAKRKQWANNNKQKYVKYVQKYVKLNKEKVKEYNRQHVQRNRHIYQAHVAARRSAKITATPSWANQQEIREIYELAHEFRQAGFDVDVDHIIPLQSERVCGLHSHHNLRPCLAFVNRQKSNRLITEDSWT